MVAICVGLDGVLNEAQGLVLILPGCWSIVVVSLEPVELEVTSTIYI